MSSDAPLMLGVSGLRGIVGRSLTPEVAMRYAGAFGAWLRGRGSGGRPARVVVGADGRAGHEPIRDAAIGGLRSAGCEVIDLGVAMTPTCGVLTDHLRADGAMIVTASHNPQEWNGLKCLVRRAEAPEAASGRPAVDACAPPARVAREIIDAFARAGAPAEARDGRGSLAAFDQGGREHERQVRSALREAGFGDAWGSRAGVRVVLDSVNASGARYTAEVLRALGAEVVQVGGERSGVFPHPPEPTRENLASLGEAVRRHGAAVGFAQDPDGDRLAIVDERGEYIGEEYTLVLAALALLEAADGGRASAAGASAAERLVCVNLATSRMIDDVAARHGVRVGRTAVGEANVVEAMKREKAAGRDVILGGEGNGGVIWPRVTYVRDSLGGMALVLALMARTGRTIGELVAGVPAYAIEKRKVDLARREEVEPAIGKLAAAYASERQDRQDGIRIDFDSRQAWLHVRASNTEPIMRLIAEAPTAAEARAILDEAARLVG